MNIFICDDDENIISQLSTYIQEYFKKNKLKCPTLIPCCSGETLLSSQQHPDIVFLDIEMPGMSGITTAAKIKGIKSACYYFYRYFFYGISRQCNGNSCVSVLK